MLSPVESLGSGALKPFRDFFGWIGDTFHAKKENGSLRTQVQRLRKQSIALQDQVHLNAQAAQTLKLDQSAGLDPARQVSARVVLHSPTIWFSTISINKGTGAGVHKNDAVVNGSGLVGRVTDAWGDGAQVTLITDRNSGVTARVVNSGPGVITGTVETGAPGNPNDLLFTGIELNKQVRAGQQLVTSGIQSSQVSSYFPPGIPIGEISKVNPNELQTSQQVHMKPFADLRNLETVQVLTETKAP